jgi:hypothetical protein
MADRDNDKPQVTQSSNSNKAADSGDNGMFDDLRLPKTELPEKALSLLAASAAEGRAAADLAAYKAANDQKRTVRESVREAKRISDESDSVRDERVAEVPKPVQPTPAPDNKSHDYAGIGMFELLGLMFGLPPSDAFYHGNPIDFRMLCFIAAGVFFGGLGTAWPAVRKNFPQQALVLSVSRIASDARYWLAIILVGFLYAASPEIYRRAVQPVAQGFTQQQVDQKVADAIAPLKKPLIPKPATSLGRVSWLNIFNGFTRPGDTLLLPKWFVIVTSPPENVEAEKELNTIFNLASTVSGSLKPAGLPDYSRDLDAPKLEGKALRGITVHGRNPAADLIAETLQNCFLILRTAEMPAGLFDYYHRQNPTVFPEDKFVWLEIGNGSPWKGNCSG